MRAGDAAVQAEPLRLRRKRLDVARQRIVGLVAMHVDAQAALGRDVAQHLDRARAVLHRALEMRNAADHVDALVERAVEILRGRRRAEIAVLRKRDELQVDIGRDLLLHVEQRIDRGEPIVADIDMAADREQALRDREIAIAQRALGDRLGRQQRLQLAPQRDAFEQGAGLVQPRQPQRQRRVHVEMDVDEGRRHQQALRVDGARRFAREAAFERRDLAVADADVELAPVGQGGVADDQVEHGQFLNRAARDGHALIVDLDGRGLNSEHRGEALRATSRRPARASATIAPRSITATRSAKRAASVRSCMMASTAPPARAAWRSNSITVS